MESASTEAPIAAAPEAAPSNVTEDSAGACHICDFWFDAHPPETAKNIAAQGEQDKEALKKFKGVDKNPVAAFNRREKMKRFDSADWMMEKSGKPGGRPNLLQRATQGKLNKPPLPKELANPPCETAPPAESSNNTE